MTHLESLFAAHAEAAAALAALPSLADHEGEFLHLPLAVAAGVDETKAAWAIVAGNEDPDWLSRDFRTNSTVAHSADCFDASDAEEAIQETFLQREKAARSRLIFPQPTAEQLQTKIAMIEDEAARALRIAKAAFEIRESHPKAKAAKEAEAHFAAAVDADSAAALAVLACPALTAADKHAKAAWIEAHAAIFVDEHFAALVAAMRAEAETVA